MAHPTNKAKRRLKGVVVFPCFFQPPICDADGSNVLLKRRKRQTIELDETEGLLYDADRDDLRVKVYSGLYVNEATDLDDELLDDDIADEIVSFCFCCLHSRFF